MDDVLDFTGTSASLGKPALSDLQGGVITAPVLFALRTCESLSRLVSKGFAEEVDLQRAVELVREAGGIERARELAEGHAREAERVLGRFPPTRDAHALACREALKALTRRVLSRDK